MAKRRLDTLLLERGLAETSDKAKALVMAGQVRVGEQPVSKPGTLIDADARLNVAQSPRYVSRGGDKLEHPLRAFGLDVSGLVAADIGASTGGFTDCFLQHGASRVYAIDVGKGELDYRLRNDPRVVVMEGVNARLLEALPEPVDVITLDLSFISLRAVLPVARRLLTGDENAGATPRFCETNSGYPGSLQAAVRGAQERGPARRRHSRSATARHAHRALRRLVRPQRLPYRRPHDFSDPRRSRQSRILLPPPAHRWG